MKVLAMYLPQFHRIKENDEWWGEGFTEWTAVKSAEKLFDGHEQPRVPLDGNYYDLLQKNTMKWQAELMKQYDIDGMCFYHYYFKDGRKILEKPAESLLRWKDVDMPFCFSWANESWVRSWSKISTGVSNSWSLKFEKERSDSENDGGLLKQDYGDKNDWDEHYKYLEPFFKDERYIKYNDMPVMMIYKPLDISCLKEMLVRWDVLAEKDGFPGIYTIGVNVEDYERYGLKGINIHEPLDTFRRFYPKRINNSDNVVRSVEYRDVWEKLIIKQTQTGASLGGFVGYDDTPRRGRLGSVVKNRSPYIFYEGMRKLLSKAKKNNAPFVFLNAWNEWGEGMYIEPDKKFGMRFLEAFKQAKDDANHEKNTDEAIVDGQAIQILREENKSLVSMIERYRGYWKVLDSWVGFIEQGKSLVAYLKKIKCNNIAVYGYGMLGKHLIFQLKKEGFDVRYVIEKKRGKVTDGIELYSMEDRLPSVDAVVVSVLYDYNDIYEELREKINTNIIPIDKIFE